MSGEPTSPHSVVGVVPAEIDCSLRTATAEDAAIVHALYVNNPQYFDTISIPLPTQDEVATELSAAERDERRVIELVCVPEVVGVALDDALLDAGCGRWVVGYLDYKLDYPEEGDATVNLLLVHQAVRDRGLGRTVVQRLEARLAGRAKRLLASIYGRNVGARRFWEGLGYRYAIDARPVVEWYGKTLP
ncbi:MAG: GNAT family N-acetyltransferase [Trueperaceae bacterium]|nr:MAG: GNAT family N-acetyltransferase [Trueperaceae bacterium]